MDATEDNMLDNATDDSQTEDKRRGSEERKRRKKRLTVDLEGDAVTQFQDLLDERNLTITQAVRQALSLLALFDDRKYELVLREKRGGRTEQRIILVR